MADYARLLDEEIHAFIARTNASYPEDAAGLDIAGQRRVYDAMCADFHAGRPDGVAVEDRSVSKVPLRIYTAGEPSCTVLYLHGGGFLVGGLDSHDDVCAEICAGTGYRVVAVAYRLSPEHKHPAAFEDARTALEWVIESFEGPVVLAGDSAGGNLAAALAHSSRGKTRRIAGQVLIYPGLGGDSNATSYHDHAEAPMLSRSDLEFYDGIRADGAPPRTDPTYAPLGDRDFRKLPRTVIFTAECDPLQSDGPAYADRLRQAEVPVHLVDEPGLVHGYLRARHMSNRARESFERIILAIEALGQGLWPYD
ncbi:alpha/beta hydrolase [Arenibacterium halophilum]|uniref:Alpha/beta hydrolase n=1 Tax=Arenibacterium halophilum TaxID=2583821 RepID=A0ABY2XE50_9RHOB|nr:alpha/beta hydrolase [Arenibacterium halophilum]TMV15254.1 alpha/beta hydrolase [Arenibacterium halophilum]